MHWIFYLCGKEKQTQKNQKKKKACGEKKNIVGGWNPESSPQKTPKIKKGKGRTFDMDLTSLLNWAGLNSLTWISNFFHKPS